MYGYDFSGVDKLERMIGWIWPFVLLDLVLRGISLWRAARKEQKFWFVALLIVNSLGILPAIYLLTNPRQKRNPKRKVSKNHNKN